MPDATPTRPCTSPTTSAFRAVLGHFATGVTIITAMDGDEPVGIAANSFTSVSLDPPLVLFCVAHTSSTWPRIERAGTFAVNILGEDHEELSRPVRPEGRRPLRSDRRGASACRARRCSTRRSPTSTAEFEAEYPGGDHKIIVGRVLDLDMREGARPLLFYKGGYSRMHEA